VEHGCEPPEVRLEGTHQQDHRMLVSILRPSSILRRGPGCWDLKGKKFLLPKPLGLQLPTAQRANWQGECRYRVRLLPEDLQRPHLRTQRPPLPVYDYFLMTYNVRIQSSDVLMIQLKCGVGSVVIPWCARGQEGGC
jgi:hypothetical protein